MTRKEAHRIASGIRDALSMDQLARLKAIDVCPKLHDGMMTIRVYMTHRTAEEPEAHIFRSEEI